VLVEEAAVLLLLVGREGAILALRRVQHQPRLSEYECLLIFQAIDLRRSGCCHSHSDPPVSRPRSRGASGSVM
jgi:hypothetical protein